ncbi:MAG: hypothetical protein ACRYG6_07830 [Janthinobacterium lividum]
MSAAGSLDAENAPEPARLDRLVFAPLRGVVVERAEWRPGQPAVPAAALPPLLAIVREGIGDQFAVWSTSGQGRPQGAAPPLGARLWPAAAKLLRAAPCPALWSATTGLAPEDFETVRTPVAQLLAHAAIIETFVAQCEPSRPPPEPRHIRTLLDEIARGGAPGFRLALVILLRRCPRLEQLAAMALSTARGDDGIEDAAYSGATYVLDAVVTHHQRAAAAPAAAGPGRARALAAEIAEAARVTRCVEAMAALRPLSRLHREVGRKRVILQTVCLDRFEELVAAMLLEPLAAGQAESAVGFAGLRKVAWELGETCDALRLLGDRHGTERAIQRTARRAGAALGDHDPQGAIATALVERLRGLSAPEPGEPR